MKRIYLGFCLILFIYMLWPTPSKISDFSPLPNSVKSQLDGDVWQVPNVAGYFSDNYRDFVIPFYFSNYWNRARLPFPPLKLNHAPEFSWKAIKKHTDSTYLEELVYPLKGSLFINGMEPFNEDKTPKFWGSTQFSADERSWYTKATLRFYPSSFLVRLVVWFGISISTLFLYKLGRKIVFND